MAACSVITEIQVRFLARGPQILISVMRKGVAIVSRLGNSSTLAERLRRHTQDVVFERFRGFESHRCYSFFLVVQIKYFIYK